MRLACTLPALYVAVRVDAAPFTADSVGADFIYCS